MDILTSMRSGVCIRTAWMLGAMLGGACGDTGATRPPSNPALVAAGTGGSVASAEPTFRTAAGSPVEGAAGSPAQVAAAGSAGRAGAGGLGDAGRSGAAASDGGGHLAMLAAAMEDYKAWQRRTPEPQSIASEIFTLCRSPLAAEQDFLDSEHGDIQLALLDWLNDGAVRGFNNPTDPFPVGAAIVKEKLKLNASGDEELSALGIMIKRERGFDAAHGDWQFGYWEPASGLLSEPAAIDSCVDCHANSPSDYVFVSDTWRIPRPPLVP